MGDKTKLEQLSDLYEEGKDCLHQLSILEDEKDSYWRLFDILKEMRDLAAPVLSNKNDNTQ